MTDLNPADSEIMKLATQDVSDDAPEAAPAALAPKDDDVLELGSADAPSLGTKAGDLTDEEENLIDDAMKKPTRSKRWEQRVDNLTARLRAAETEAAELRAKASPEAPTESAEPDAGKYEFGEADPQYIRDFATYTVKQTLADERKASKEQDEASAKQNEITSRLSTGIANVEKAGAEKYEDFEAKINEAVEARGGEPLPPLVSIGIAVSPAGADIAYKLATDEDAADKIEKLAKTNPQAAAVAFGELEGEYLDEDNDLNLSDPMDMARMLGRMKARLAGKGKTVERKVSKAPEPPEQRARGAGGKFDVSDDTEDFAAFERKVMGKR